MAACVVASIGTASYAEMPAGDIASKAVANCAAKDNGIERLACYDDLAARWSLAKPSSKATDVGKWVVHSETSKIDDRTNVFLAVQSLEAVRDRHDRSHTAFLYVRCTESRTSIYINFGGFYMTDHDYYQPATTRIDQRRAQGIRVSESTDKSALFLDTPAVPFVKSMFGAKKFLIRATPVSESPVTFEFPVSGLEGIIAPLRKACGW